MNTAKISQFKTLIDHAETLGLSIIEEESKKYGSERELSRALRGDEYSSFIANSKLRFEKGRKMNRSKIGLLAEIVRQIENLPDSI